MLNIELAFQITNQSPLALLSGSNKCPPLSLQAVLMSVSVFKLDWVFLAYASIELEFVG